MSLWYRASILKTSPEPAGRGRSLVEFVLVDSEPLPETQAEVRQWINHEHPSALDEDLAIQIDQTLDALSAEYEAAKAGGGA